MDASKLFWKLLGSATEDEIHAVLKDAGLLQSPKHWTPYGDNESNYAIVENQQASPIPALVEKVTNGVDAILEKRCLEEGFDPESTDAPRSVEEAVDRFFPNHKNWDLLRREQAGDLQIVADGPRMNTSLLIYDNGIGQEPENFGSTFMSLVRGNKNKIMFLQGKYNMGGAGAVVFCGNHRYQLIASRRFDGSSRLGFTLLRRHPLDAAEEMGRKNTWYEYLVFDNIVPSFDIDEIDIGLAGRNFKTGSFIKLYSYDLPAGSRSVISRDLNQSLNEYLFNPPLPVLTVDTKIRYPDDRNLERDLFGLKRRLEEQGSKYVEDFFSNEIEDSELGRLKVTCYVFKARSEGRSAKETRETLQREFFKNNMSVPFSLNGQVHGHFTSEFITRSLKFPLLKNHLLIHVDCTHVRPAVRNELFMASRDRLKSGDVVSKLRKRLTKLLRQGRLKSVNAQRKASLNVESSDANELLRSMTKRLPLQDNLAKLLNQTFKLEDPRPGKSAKPNGKTKTRNTNKAEVPFHPKRFPSTFSLETKLKSEDGIPLIMLPKGSTRMIRFTTDVEDQYFDRVNEPGELKIAVLGRQGNGGDNGTKQGALTDVKEAIDVVKSSPEQGMIRVRMTPREMLDVGDEVRIKAELTHPSGNLEEVFMVKVSNPEGKPARKGATPEPQDNRLGLPEPIMVYETARDGLPDGVKVWEDVEAAGQSMTHGTVVCPVAGEDGLEQVLINMDSSALLNFRSSLTSIEQIEVADKRYFSAVYFHTLFLYAITKNRGYELQRDGLDAMEEPSPVEITEYISDLFSSAYAQFLLSFDTSELMSALEN